MSLPDDDDLLRHARSGMTPGDDAQREMRARLLSSVAAVGAAGAAGGAASSAAASSAGAGVGLSAKLLIVALSVSAIGGIGYVATQPAEPAPASAAQAGRRGTHAADVRTGTPQDPADPARAIDEAVPVAPTDTSTETSSPGVVGIQASNVGATPGLPAAPSTASARASTSLAPPTSARSAAAHRPEGVAPSPTPDAVDPPIDALAEESALIRRARTALQGGDAAGSLRALEAHAARYPDGVLAEERDVQRVRALCLQGETERASSLAAGFLRAHPNSMHSPAMRQPCGDAP